MTRIMKGGSCIAAALLLIADAVTIRSALGQQPVQTPMESWDGGSAYALLVIKSAVATSLKLVLRATGRMGTAPTRNTPSLRAKQQATSITNSVLSSEEIGSRT